MVQDVFNPASIAENVKKSEYRESKGGLATSEIQI